MKIKERQDKFLSAVMDNLKVPTIAQIKALELFLSTSSDKINPEEKDLIELTLNSCNNMQKMIDNFSFISKLNSEKINLDYKYFNFKELTEGILEEMSILLKYSELNSIFVQKGITKFMPINQELKRQLRAYYIIQLILRSKILK